MQPEPVMTNELIAESAAELREHARVLAEFATRLMPEREQLIDAWSSMDVSHPRAWYEETARVLFDGLVTANEASAPEVYLNGVAEWSRVLAASGANYASAVGEFTHLRCGALQLMLKVYQAGPELQLLFSGLDALERATRSVIAAAFIESAQAQLTQGARLRMVGHLTQGISHSLNNLLANIIGRAQLLENSISDPRLQLELHQIETAARTAGESVRRVQDYAAPRGEDELVALDVNAVVNDAMQLTRYRWRDDAEASGIVIDVIRDLGEVPPVLARRGELRDALVELILNAAEAMPLGGSVTVRTERVGDKVQVSVGDLGEGMDAATRANATRPFFTTKGAGHVGLGLTTVAAMAQTHHGRFELDSAPGRGTTATLALPLASNVSSAQAPAPVSLTKTLKLLVVDDDASLREIAYKALLLRGHEVQMAESGFEALQLVRENGPFDAVLTDLGMPGMNGFEVAHEVKALHPETVVILTTGWAAELDTNKMRESGVDRTVHKPFDVEQVLQLIAEALATRG